MRQKDKTEVQKTRALKSARTAIRLKHSLLADEEINEVLPEIEDAFDEAVALGKPYKLDVASVFEEKK